MYYFVEALHYAGISDTDIDSLDKVLRFNPKWVNEFNNMGVNPVIVSVKEGNANVFSYIMKNYEISEIVKSNLYQAAFEIKSTLNQAKILKVLIQDKSINKDFVWRGGKKMPHLLARGTSENIDLVANSGIDFKVKDLKNNDWFEDFFLSDWEHLDEKFKLFKKMIEFYSIDELLDLKINGKTLTDEIDSRDMDISQKLKEIVNEHIKLTMELT